MKETDRTQIKNTPNTLQSIENEKSTVSSKEQQPATPHCLSTDQIKNILFYSVIGGIIIGDPIATTYLFYPCYSGVVIPLIKHQKVHFDYWDSKHSMILAAVIVLGILAILLSTKRGGEFLKKYLAFIFVVSAIMGIAEGAPAAFFGGDTIKGLGGGTALSTISLFVIFVAAGLLSYSLFKDSMDEGKIKLKGVISRYKFVFLSIWYFIRGQREKIKELKIINFIEYKKNNSDGLKPGELKPDPIKAGKNAKKEFLRSLITVIATFLSIAAAVTCAALAANCLIGMWNGAPMIGLAVIAFIAELIATTAIYNMYFAETVTDAIYGSRKGGWLKWYWREITGQEHPKDPGDQENKEEPVQTQNLTTSQKFYRGFFAFLIKGILFPALSIAVCFIATYIFYLQLATLHLPGIPALSHSVIIGILVPGMLVTGVFRIVSLKIAANWTYDSIIGGIDWLRGKIQNTKNKDESIIIKGVSDKASNNENKKIVKPSKSDNKAQENKPASKTSKKVFGAILAIINGASLGSGVTSPTKLFPEYLQSHKSLCMALYIITGAALTLASIAANLSAWNAPPKKLVEGIFPESADNDSDLPDKEQNIRLETQISV